MTELLKKYDNWLLSDDLNELSFDLQLFAAEDEGRTEEPTERKIKEARDKGQVAKTQEFPQSAVVILSISTVLALSSMIYDTTADITKYYISSFSTMQITELSIRKDFFFALMQGAKVLAPIFLVASLAAIFGNVLQVGWLFTTHPLKFDMSKLKFGPSTIMKKIFFSKQIAMNLFKSIFKVFVIGFVSYLVVSADFEDILKTTDVSITASLKLILMSGFKIIVWTSVTLIALAIPDFIFQKSEHKESLKMSKQEVKEEMKESSGDPQLKAKLREMQRDIAMKNMIHEVPKADVVVTNPTHFAIALKYDTTVMEAPMVIAKGLDSMALRIREVARENGIEMIENRPLAQEMYKRVEIGDVVPADLFSAVALIYKELYENDKYKAV